MSLIKLLHTRLKIDTLPDNKSSRLLRFHTVGDLHLVLESVLRARGIGSEQLYQRMQAAVSVNTISMGAFNALHAWFVTTVSQADRDTAAALNSVLTEAQSRVGSATTTAERAGIVGYANVRTRNSVQHVIDGKTEIFTKPATADLLSAWTLASLRNVMHSVSGTL